MKETMRRISLDSDRRWEKRLNQARVAGKANLSKFGVRRVGTRAAQATCAWFERELKRRDGPYRTAPERGSSVIGREIDIGQAIDDRVFDLDEDNGVRDKRIVVEAMARGYDVLTSNNNNSIDHGRLKVWMKEEGERLGVVTTLLRPEEAEEKLRESLGKKLEWTEYAAARSCITDPYNKKKAKQEMEVLLEPLGRRGMGETQNRIYRALQDSKRWDHLLEHVATHGQSHAGRAEAEGRRQAVNEVNRATNMGW